MAAIFPPVEGARGGGEEERELPRRRRGAILSSRTLFVGRGANAGGVLSHSLAVASGEASRQLIEDSQTYRAVLQEVKREALYNDLMDDVTRFWKAQGDPDWAAPARGLFRARCGEIVRQRRDAACLRAEVDHAFLLRAEATTWPREDAHQRSCRLRGFWSHYCSRGTAGAQERDSACWRAWTPTEGSPLQPRLRASGVSTISTSAAQSLLPRCETPASSSRASCRRRPPAAWGRREAPEMTPRTGSRMRRRPFTEELEVVMDVDTPWGPNRCQSVAEQRPRSTAGSTSARRRQSEESDSQRFPAKRQVRSERLAGRAGDHEAEARCTPRSPDYGLESHRSPSQAGTARTPRAASVAQAVPATPLNCWTPPAGGAQVEKLVGPCQKYIEKCHESGIAPLQVPFFTGHSKKLSLPDMSLEDRQVPPILAMAAELEEVEDVDLSRNHMLTDRSLAPLFKMLRGRPSAATVLQISLGGCRGLGQDTLKALAALLWDPCSGVVGLRSLDLSGVAIPAHGFVALASAIGLHRSIEELKLADTGLGRSVEAQSCKVITELVKCQSLAALDMGWSVFSAKVFEHLGLSLASARRLASLSIPNCSSSTPTGTFRDLPIEYFLERLASLPTLTRLDVSLNRIDYRGALILEDALALHERLAQLDMSDNYLGVLGLRSMLRLLASESAGLRVLRCDACADLAASSAEHSEDGRQVFSATCPGGRYALDLQRPYHRSLLRLFYKTCERFRLPPQQAFTDLAFSAAAAYHHPRKDAKGQWPVQAQGRLLFTFKLGWALDRKSSADRKPSTDRKSLAPKAARLWDFAAVLRRQAEAARLRPSFRKSAALLAHWRALEGRKADRLAILDAIGSDFLLSFAQLLELSSCEELAAEVLSRTLHCLDGGNATRYLSLTMFTPLQYIQNCARLQQLLGFNADNPTGAYDLDLANPSDTMVAEQLLTLDRWEMDVDAHLQRADVSQWGNRSHVRNMSHQGQPLQDALMTEWIRPTSGKLKADYASGKRPPSRAAAVDDRTFAKLLLTLHASRLKAAVTIPVLRLVSHCLFLRSLQLRELLGCFQAASERMDVLVLMYFRVVDLHNEKVFRVQFEAQEDIERLRQRLGYAAFFPHCQPERAFFRLDLGQHDQRMAASMLVQLKEKEALQNLQRYSLTDTSGRVDCLPAGVPQTWAQHERVPESGVFEAYYVCSPQVRSFATRKAICEKYGFLKLAVSERDVMWWSGLREMPPDVQEFMEWLYKRFPNAKKAFERFCPSGVGALAISRFRQVLAELRFKAFRGHGEQQRTDSLFRYLNASGQGEVSESEWMVLEQTFSDISVSLKEFVFFLQRAFPGDEGCLDLAWGVLDEEGLGEIQQHEWPDRVKKLGYYNCAATIFRWLDADRGGEISLDEFRTLSRFLKDEGAEGGRAGQA